MNTLTLNNNPWVPCSQALPPENRVVNTKIDDTDGCRNVGLLQRNGRLWYLPDNSMYVYYRPTHWQETLIAPEI